MLIGGADPLGMPSPLYSRSRAPEHNVSNTNGFRTSLIYHDAFRNLLKLNDHNNIFKSFYVSLHKLSHKSTTKRYNSSSSNKKFIKVTPQSILYYSKPIYVLTP